MLRGLIGSFRPVVILFGALVILGFKIVGETASSCYLCLTVVVIAWATMAQNDHRDRFFDFAKGRKWAYKNPELSLLVCVLLWTFSLGMAAYSEMLHPRTILITLPMIVSGLLYSELQKIPFLANIQVALTASACLLFPVVMRLENAEKIWPILFAAICLIWAREILKEYEDIDWDNGKKWNCAARLGSAASILAGILIVLALWNITPNQKSILSIPPFVVAGSHCLFAVRNNYTQTKTILDIGIVLYLLLNLVMPAPP